MKTGTSDIYYMMDKAGTGFITVNKDNIIMQLNETAAEYFSVSKEELTGEKLLFEDDFTNSAVKTFLYH